MEQKCLHTQKNKRRILFMVIDEVNEMNEFDIIRLYFHRTSGNPVGTIWKGNGGYWCASVGRTTCYVLIRNGEVVDCQVD